MNTNELFELTVTSFGREAQKAMAMEECSELINALCKEKRGRVTDKDIITEIADVQIMCNQLALIYGKDEVRDEKARKEWRLFSRLQEQGLIPEYAGLYEVTDNNFISEVIKPPKLHDERISDADLDLCRKFYFNYREYKYKYESGAAKEIERLRYELSAVKEEFKAVTGFDFRDSL